VLILFLGFDMGKLFFQKKKSLRRLGLKEDGDFAKYLLEMMGMMQVERK